MAHSSKSKVSNPLTVIAIFAGIAEVSGTITLVNVSSEIQVMFVWFVMGFPVLLVILFFIVLLFNPKVLYAPSDFENEQNYVDLMTMKSKLSALRTSNQKEKIKETIVDVEQALSSKTPNNPNEDWDPVIKRMTEIRDIIEEPDYDVDDVMLMMELNTRLNKGESEEDLISFYGDRGLEKNYIQELLIALKQPLE